MTKAVVRLHIPECQQSVEGWTVFLTNTKPTNVQLPNTAGLQSSFCFILAALSPSCPLTPSAISNPSGAGTMTVLHDFWDNKILINRKIIVRVYFIEDGCGKCPYVPASSRLKVVSQEYPVCCTKRDGENWSKGNLECFWSTNGHVEKAIFLLLISPSLSSGLHNFIFFLQWEFKMLFFSSLFV